MGADRKVLDWAKVAGYFRQLELNSDRLRVEELGGSVRGRPLIAVTIAEPDTIRNLDSYREVQRRLADPRITSAAEAETLCRQGKTVVLITCTVHSTEIASTHTAIEFAYRLLTEHTARTAAMLHDTILLLVPSLNPDGLDLVTSWYRRTLDTPYEGTAPPELYHPYVGHDNNRDWYIFSQPETRLIVSKLHNRWHPQVVYDVHQQGPYAARMFLPPWTDPIEPNVDPILIQEMNAMGTAMAADLTAAGKQGVVVNALYDFWSPSRQYQAYHGGLRILSESASASLASPVTVRSEQLEGDASFDPRKRSWNHPEPWDGGEWRLRDIVDYQLVAMESCLYQSAVHRQDLLRNFYTIGRRATERISPAGFLIPATQTDPGATRALLETLGFGMVQIERTVDGGHYISLAQPYGSFAKTLLETQNYPDLRLYRDGPPKRPYDATAHTLPLLMGVNVAAVERRPPGALTRIDIPRREEQAHERTAFSAADTDAWRTINRIWNSGAAVWRNPKTGDFAPNQPDKDWVRLKRPRVGLYRSFVPSMDEGWTRWLLEYFGFAYRSVGNHQIQDGSLRATFDVVIFPDQPASEIANGYREGSMPPEFCGGLGTRGAEQLRAFASSGGTLVFLNRSTAYSLDALGIARREVTHGVLESEYFSPGSLLRVRLAPQHPLTLGLPSEITIWSEQSPAWEPQPDSVATYPENRILASGWLLGERVLAGRSALCDVRLGNGHVILFGMRPQYRAQSYQTFKLFFNALVYPR